MRRTFLVGRVTRKGSEVVVVAGDGMPPFPGPWTLKAMIRPNSATPRSSYRVRR